MMPGQEVIAVQIGTYSNWVGCHWWNLQKQSFCFDKVEADNDETRIQHDYLFREGRNNAGKATYTPRLIVIDEDSKLDNKQLGMAQYSPDSMTAGETAQMMWDGNFAVEQREESVESVLQSMNVRKSIDGSSNANEANHGDGPPAKKHSPLPSTTQASWTGSLKVAFHPKSLLPVKDLPTSEFSNISTYRSGVDMFSENSQYLEDFQERLRYFAEDCDNLQGFNILYDLSTGFAGIADRILESIQDEFSRKMSLCFPLVSGDILPKNMRERHQVTLNCTKSLLSSTTYAHMTTPIGLTKSLLPVQNDLPRFRKFNNIHYSGENSCETSGILASYLESVTSSWRLNDSPDRLVDIVTRMNLGSRKIFSSSIALPLGLENGLDFPEFISGLKNGGRYIPSVCLTPWLTDSSKIEPAKDLLRLRFLNLRGAKHLSMMDKRDGNCQPCNPAEQLWNLYGNTSLYTSITYCNEPIPTLDPFPAFFSPGIGENGLLSATATVTQPVSSVPVLSILESSPKVCNLLDQLMKQWNSVRPDHQLCDVDDWEEMRESMFQLKDGHRAEEYNFSDVDSD